MAERRSSVFTSEWRRCLSEHYKYVMRSQDKATEKTLLPILHRVGFTEAELSSLYRDATQHVDDLPDGFVPDLEKALPSETLTEVQPQTTFQTHPAECNCAACMDEVLEVGHDADGQPIPEDERDDETDTAADSPQQRSLF